MKEIQFAGEDLGLRSGSNVLAIAATDDGAHAPLGVYGQATPTQSAKTWRVGQRFVYVTQVMEHELEVLADHTTDAGGVLVDLIAGRLRIVRSERRLGAAYTYPAEWTGPTPNVFWRDDGEWMVEQHTDSLFRAQYSVKPTDPKARGIVTYWVAASGSDANDGLTPASPLRSLGAALAKPDVLTVMLEGGGVYECASFQSGISVNLVGYGRERAIIFGTPGSSTFAAEGTANVWALTSTLTFVKPASARIFDGNGVPVGYQAVASIAEVSQTPLSYMLSTDSKTLYVHAASQPIIGEDIFATYSGGYHSSLLTTASDTTGCTVYLENLTFPCTVRALADDPSTRLHALNVAACGGTTTSSWILNGIDLSTVFHRCIAAYGEHDGFGYTNGSQIESACLTYANGAAGSSTQGSTSHEGALTLRIGGEYESAGQNCLLDVGFGQTLNLGCKAGSRVSIHCFSVAADRKMWCIDCRPGAVTGRHYDAGSTVPMVIDGNLRGAVLGGVGAIELAPQV